MLTETLQFPEHEFFSLPRLEPTFKTETLLYVGIARHLE